MSKRLKAAKIEDLEFEGLIQNKEAKIGIVGLGYVGLPLLLEFAKSGFTVTGIDIDTQKVKLLEKGKSYIQDVSDKELNPFIEMKRINPTSSFEVIERLDAVIICVPTPLVKTKDPDLSHVVSAAKEIKKWLGKGQLIILESTTYPGTTEEIVLPILSEKGKKVGRDFFLAFSPERVDPGNQEFQIQNTPKIVGGVTPFCTKLATQLYQSIVKKVIPVSSTMVAEMVKLLENTFRSVNIALVNEVALLSNKLGIDVWEVIDAAATKPFGFMPFHPGPGIGGHCIPVDPFYLSWKAKQNGFEARFIELAGKINGSMPEHVVNKITESLNDRSKSVRNSKLLVLGVAYKKDIDDIRESPALDILALLFKLGANLSYHDPYVPSLNVVNQILSSVNISKNPIKNYDCVIIVTNHSSFDYEMVVKESQLIIDTRNALKGFRQPHIVRL
ncbi:MAG TPA: nucleotide sugar dehydrogenase [Nitrospiria bacterium]|jgi:UDP-N-acetyl-D-glucosamine dehydrogenase